jgi:hypothetical protein
VDFSSAVHVSIETYSGNSVDCTIFRILVDKQHPRTACNLVLHIHHATHINGFVVDMEEAVILFKRHLKRMRFNLNNQKN